MFLEESDLGQAIYNEILNSITREDDTFIQENIDTTITQIDSVLRLKYDTSKLWSQTGNNRDKLILRIAVDICLYHIYSVLEEVPVIRRERYDYAVKELNSIRAGNMLLTSIPLLSSLESTEDNEIVSATNSQRY